MLSIAESCMFKGTMATVGGARHGFYNLAFVCLEKQYLGMVLFDPITSKKLQFVFARAFSARKDLTVSGSLAPW